MSTGLNCRGRGNLDFSVNLLSAALRRFARCAVRKRLALECASWAHKRPEDQHLRVQFQVRRLQRNGAKLPPRLDPAIWTQLQVYNYLRSETCFVLMSGERLLRPDYVASASQ